MIPCTEQSCGCLSLLSVFCFHVVVCATGWSLLQRRSMDVCLLWVLCVFRSRSVQRADHLDSIVLWMSVCLLCCVLSCSYMFDGRIPFTESSYGFLSIVSVLCCQVEVCATFWSLVQGSRIYICLFWFFIWLGSGLCVGLITCTEEPSGCQSVVSFVFCQRSLRRPDHLCRRVLWFSVCCECCVLPRRGLCDAWSLVQSSPMDVSLLWVLCVVR